MTEHSTNLAVRPVPVPGREDALQLLFGHLPEGDRETMVRSLLAGLADEPESLAGLFEAHREEARVGVVWGQLQPGATALLWPPAVLEGESDAAAEALLAAATQFLAEHRVRMAQAMLESADDPKAESLKRAGFAHFAELLYLIRVVSSLPETQPASRLEFEPYNEQHYDRLARVVQKTYQATRDCPELNGVRNIDDVLAGYRATGNFDPQNWRLVRAEGQDVGCLLLADHPGVSNFELVYMGLIPAARGKGYGLDVSRYAQWCARRAGRERLVLAVDSANDFAIATYTRAGFVSWAQRSVFLRIFGG